MACDINVRASLPGCNVNVTSAVHVTVSLAQTIPFLTAFPQANVTEKNNILHVNIHPSDTMTHRNHFE